MANLLTRAWEAGVAVGADGLDAATAGTPTITTTNPIEGGASLNVNAPLHGYVDYAAGLTRYFGWYIRMEASGDQQQTVHEFQTATGARVAQFRLSGSNEPRVYNAAGSLLATLATEALVIGQTYRFGLRLTVATATSGLFQLYKDGALIYENAAMDLGATALGRWRMGGLNSQAGAPKTYLLDYVQVDDAEVPAGIPAVDTGGAASRLWRPSRLRGLVG